MWFSDNVFDNEIVVTQVVLELGKRDGGVLPSALPEMNHRDSIQCGNGIRDLRALLRIVVSMRARFNRVSLSSSGVGAWGGIVP